MGKAAILIIVASIAFGSMYAFGAKEDAKQAESRLSTHQFEVLARNAALAGYNMAKQELSEGFDAAPTHWTGDYDGVDYEVTIARNGNHAHVTAVGTATTGSNKPVEYTIDAVIEREIIPPSIAEEAPEFMQYALMSEDDLTIKGNVEMETYLTVDGNEDNTLNANMHTNGNLTVKGNAATVRGFGTYVGWADGKLNNTFKPYYNPTNDPVAKQVPRVDLPTFDVTDLLSKTTVDHATAGDLTLSGTYDLGGTRENPYVWHVSGSLTGNGNVVINGYALFIVEGNVSFGGNFEAGPTNWDGSDESSIALYATGTIEMRGNSEIYGQIYTGTGVSFLGGTPTVIGSLATTGGVTLAGTPNIFYREPSPALTTVFEDPEIQLTLLSYSEF